ncbi:MAG: putative G2-specific protein kinase nim-1 [Streblomastix strix]|uniref:non-specific serine/threonine protein kinase n=1 Tax=Streblomastix strix TaxID=222440 RepID=A0A5J4TUN2_9EUKA|nr:MAG: putative G2-specific protein kinase nim-1 [Streblomastix strix]
MEYCEKGDLRKVISDIQNLPQEERVMCVWAIFGQMARALDNLHSKCVIHRDIKPENIFVMADGSVRLGDFGFAKDIQNENYATTAGTMLVYQAIEVFTWKKMFLSTYVFAIGIIVAELLTGEHPFKAEHQQVMIERIKRNDHEESPSCDVILQIPLQMKHCDVQSALL